MGRHQNILSMLLLVPLLAAACGFLASPAPVAANHQNYGYWHPDGCYYGQFGDPGYGYWARIECASTELGYVGTDSCYYHSNGDRYIQQLCWISGQNGDYVSYVGYTDGAMFTFSRFGGVISRAHFQLDQDNILWIEVVPELSSSGWMRYDEYLLILTLQDMIRQLEQMEAEQAAQATASANNLIMVSQQWRTYYSQAYENIYSLDFVW